jgi:hypothetical protein
MQRIYKQKKQPTAKKKHNQFNQKINLMIKVNNLSKKI